MMTRSSSELLANRISGVALMDVAVRLKRELIHSSCFNSNIKL